MLNAPIIKIWFRWVMRINGDRSGVGKSKIIEIIPNAIFWRKGEKYVAEFRTHAKFSKRIYYAFRWVWLLFHAWDWLLADRFLPRLGFGFNSFTCLIYPDSGNPGIGGVDARLNSTFWGGAADWDLCRSDPGVAENNPDNNPETLLVQLQTDTSPGDTWVAFSRSAFHFDTRVLGSLISIESGIISFFGSNGSNDWWAENGHGAVKMVICESLIASDNEIVSSDYLLEKWGDMELSYNQIGCIAFKGGEYNDFQLNPQGTANIKKGGISKFGTRTDCDLYNAPPYWEGNIGAATVGYFADIEGKISDPKLTVIYSRPYPYTAKENPFTKLPK